MIEPVKYPVETSQELKINLLTAKVDEIGLAVNQLQSKTEFWTAKLGELKQAIDQLKAERLGLSSKVSAVCRHQAAYKTKVGSFYCANCRRFISHEAFQKQSS